MTGPSRVTAVTLTAAPGHPNPGSAKSWRTGHVDRKNVRVRRAPRADRPCAVCPGRPQRQVETVVQVRPSSPDMTVASPSRYPDLVTDEHQHRPRRVVLGARAGVVHQRELVGQEVVGTPDLRARPGSAPPVARRRACRSRSGSWAHRRAGPRVTCKAASPFTADEDVERCPTLGSRTTTSARRPVGSARPPRTARPVGTGTGLPSAGDVPPGLELVAPSCPPYAPRLLAATRSRRGPCRCPTTPATRRTWPPPGRARTTSARPGSWPTGTGTRAAGPSARSGCRPTSPVVPRRRCRPGTRLCSRSRAAGTGPGSGSRSTRASFSEGAPEVGRGRVAVRRQGHPRKRGCE